MLGDGLPLWAGKSSSEYHHRREVGGWMWWREGKGGRGVLNAAWTTKLKNKRKDDGPPHLSICCKSSHLFTIYFIYFGDARAEQFNIFFSVCCVLEWVFSGTRLKWEQRRLWSFGGWKQSIQIWLEDNLEMSFWLPLKATDRRQTCY